MKQVLSNNKEILLAERPSSRTDEHNDKKSTGTVGKESVENIDKEGIQRPCMKGYQSVKSCEKYVKSCEKYEKIMQNQANRLNHLPSITTKGSKVLR